MNECNYAKYTICAIAIGFVAYVAYRFMTGKCCVLSKRPPRISFFDLSINVENLAVLGDDAPSNPSPSAVLTDKIVPVRTTIDRSEQSILTLL